MTSHQPATLRASIAGQLTASVAKLFPAPPWWLKTLNDAMSDEACDWADWLVVHHDTRLGRPVAAYQWFNNRTAANAMAERVRQNGPTDVFPLGNTLRNLLAIEAHRLEHPSERARRPSEGNDGPAVQPKQRTRPEDHTP